MEFLSQYGLFLAKTLTFLIGIVLTFSALLGLILKAKARKEEGTLLISNLNEKMEDIQASIQSETLSKEKWKKWQKIQKKKAKEQSKKEEEPSRLFVIRFDGDIRASQVNSLRETVSAICEVACPRDEVLVVLESAGGFVHSYGLAASQLQRVKDRKLRLTVAIDKFAASGGYMMACVADQILAAPFAIVGSIGVVAQLPNFHRLLTKNEIDFELHTAGKYKRTLTLFGENTEEGRKKFQEEIEETHELFKQHISHFRPQLNMDEIATGEHWHAVQALNYQLIDKLQTSDDFILEKMKSFQVFELSYEEKQGLTDRIASGLFSSLEKGLLKVLSKSHPSLLR